MDLYDLTVAAEQDVSAYRRANIDEWRAAITELRIRTSYLNRLLALILPLMAGVVIASEQKSAPSHGVWGEARLSDAPICPQGYMCPTVQPETIVDTSKGKSLTKKATFLNIGEYVKDKNGCLYLITNEGNKLAIRAVFERSHDRALRQVCNK